MADTNYRTQPLNWLVAVDGSPSSWAAWDAVLYLLDPKQDQLTTVTVVDDREDDSHGFQEDIEKELKKANTGMPEENLKTAFVEKKKDTKTTVVQYGAKCNADLLAVGVHGRRMKRRDSVEDVALRILGSTSDFSLRTFPKTSVIAKSSFEKPEKGKAIWVCGVDGSINSQNGYKIARQLMVEGDYIYVVHVKPVVAVKESSHKEFRPENISAKYKELLQDDKYGEFLIIDSGDEVPAVLSEFIEQKGAHFVSVGADGMGAFMKGTRIMGSVSDNLVKDTKTATCIISQINTVE